MSRKKIYTGLMLALAFTASVQARPLLTEPVATVGKHIFETGGTLSQRIDQFGPGDQRYETVLFPVYAKFGFLPYLDAGFTLLYADQHYQHGESQLSGALSGAFSPEIKVSPWESLGFQTIFHLARTEDESQQLSITRGNDVEFNLLMAGPDAFIKSHLNIGYVWRGYYNSRFGVNQGVMHHVVPGNIFQSKFALEMPLHWYISALLEGTFYKFDREKVDGRWLDGSSGEAADVLTGLSWDYKNWIIGAGVAFGLLDERHTSFDLTRGAGDTTVKLSLAYKLTPHKPVQ